MAYRFGNGKKKLTIRAATPGEMANFTKAKKAAVDGSDDLVLVYLVEIDE